MRRTATEEGSTAAKEGRVGAAPLPGDGERSGERGPPEGRVAAGAPWTMSADALCRLLADAMLVSVSVLVDGARDHRHPGLSVAQLGPGPELQSLQVLARGAHSVQAMREGRREQGEGWVWSLHKGKMVFSMNFNGGWKSNEMEGPIKK